MNHDTVRIRAIRLALAASATFVLGLAAAHAQGTAPAAAPAASSGAAPAGSAPAAAEPVRDPKAIAALQAMGAYLRSLKAFQVRSDFTIDEVMTDGRKLQFAGTVEYKVKSPDRMRVAVRTDRRQRDLVYDGRTVVQYAPRMKYWTSYDAPKTISETLDALDERWGIELPLADLFLWGTGDDGAASLLGAEYIGPASIGGLDCDHYAFRDDGLDWQVWIRRGKQPLPCKLVITTTTDPTQPQYVATLKWNTSPAFDAATFKFVAPKGARRIEAAQAAGASK